MICDECRQTGQAWAACFLRETGERASRAFCSHTRCGELVAQGVIIERWHDIDTATFFDKVAHLTRGERRGTGH